jgi:hypothetical protein
VIRYDDAEFLEELRRKYAIDRKFQWSVAPEHISDHGGGCFCHGADGQPVFVYFLNERLSSSIDWPYLIKLGAILLFMAAGIVIWRVLRTHAVAGPIFETRKILQAAARGEFPAAPVRFRRGDAFQGLADDLNDCLAFMRLRRPETIPGDQDRRV